MRVRLPGTIFPTFFLPFALVFCFAAGPGFVLAADVHLVTYDGPITPVARASTPPKAKAPWPW